MDSKQCGCFFCLRIFNPEKIQDWIQEETAVCPFCAVDSVIPESEEYDLTDQLLLDMKDYWF